ncbi:unnamed protein product, partial [Mesorhabditis spiculigera]
MFFRGTILMQWMPRRSTDGDKQEGAAVPRNERIDGNTQLEMALLAATDVVVELTTRNSCPDRLGKTIRRSTIEAYKIRFSTMSLFRPPTEGGKKGGTAVPRKLGIGRIDCNTQLEMALLAATGVAVELTTRNSCPDQPCKTIRRNGMEAYKNLE